jgi:hypothetical protein
MSDRLIVERSPLPFPCHAKLNKEKRCFEGCEEYIKPEHGYACLHYNPFWGCKIKKAINKGDKLLKEVWGANKNEMCKMW